jgi:hypothetical protein
MKIFPAVIFLLLGFFFNQSSFAQDSATQNQPAPESIMQDTIIVINPAYVIMERYAYKDSMAAARALSLKMQDTTIVMDLSFTVQAVYAAKDSLDATGGIVLSPRELFLKKINDSLSAIGSALLHTADMQDTTISLLSSFVLKERYTRKDSLDAARDTARALLARAATMQDTTIDMDPAFRINNRYAAKDRYQAFKDSVWAALAQAASMQDTTILTDPAFVVRNVYEKKDRLDAARDSLAWPTIMRDTVIAMDSSFVISDFYTRKDFLDSIRISQKAYVDSVYTDSVSRHWAGWKKYEIESERSYTLNAENVLKSRSRNNLQYNIADFYLYLNGELVKPEKSDLDFFAAGCLAFKYDDTILLNSGLGFKVGVGVGIKIIGGRFTSSLHANKRNEELYKSSEDDSVYQKSIITEPVTQSLKLPYEPSYVSDEIITGEYVAAYRKFYQKNEDGQDELRRYTVRIIFRCRVRGGLDTMKSLR